MNRYVIIGNGVAAAACIEGIRSTDPDGSIDVVSAERHDVYCRPLISYYLEGKTDLSRMRYRSQDFYDSANCSVHRGWKAVRIRKDAREIELDDGSVLPYTALCLATGSSPFIPPFEGLDTVENRFSFLTLDDAFALEKALTPESRVLYGTKAAAINPAGKTVRAADGEVVPYDTLCVAAGSSPFVPPFDGLETVERPFTFLTLDEAVALKAATEVRKKVLIVGAGLIGLKCAEGLRGRAESVTVCDLADRVLSSILDAESAGIVQRHLEEHGIRFCLKDSAVLFEHDRAQMKSGASIPFDVLVLAVGVRANTSLLRDIGGETDRGILVDPYMRTSVPGIWAAGDCAQGYDLSTGTKRVLALLPNAVMQGHAAGVNMAGGSSSFDKGIPMNAIGFFGLHIMTAGVYEGDLYEEKDERSLKRLYTKDDLLKGFILVGRQERAGIYTSMIRERTPLSSVDFETMKHTATTAAFSSDARRKKFGGVV